MTTTDTAIAANLKSLAEILGAVAERAAEAAAAMEAGARNQAVGTALGIDEDLQAALALHGAAVALHRR